MEKFSEKSLLSLGDYYVYGLIDPRNRKIFYIGKGTGNRVFEHELESQGNPESEKLKLKRIAEIKAAGLEVEKVIINCNLTEAEAFAAEAALINAFNYVEDTRLTNIVAGHHSAEALTVDDFEKIYGAEELQESDIRHKVMIIKINKLYQKEMTEDCKDALEKLPKHVTQLTSKMENRVFFVDEGFENHELMDEAEKFYLYRSIAGLKVNQSAQNPITYLEPKE